MTTLLRASGPLNRVLSSHNKEVNIILDSLNEAAKIEAFHPKGNDHSIACFRGIKLKPFITWQGKVSITMTLWLGLLNWAEEWLHPTLRFGGTKLFFHHRRKHNNHTFHLSEPCTLWYVRLKKLVQSQCCLVWPLTIDHVPATATVRTFTVEWVVWPFANFIRAMWLCSLCKGSCPSLPVLSSLLSSNMLWKDMLLPQDASCLVKPALTQPQGIPRVIPICPVLSLPLPSPALSSVSISWTPSRVL